MESANERKPVSWRNTWWGISLIILGVFILAVIFLFGYFTIIYWRDIRAGKGDLIKQDLAVNLENREKKSPSGLNAEELEILEGPGAHVLGNPSASATIVEFIDLKCPNSKAAAPIIRQVAQRYGRQAKIIIRHFPVESLYPGATQAAELAHCAHLQGDFWGMHDLLFQNQERLGENITPEQIARLAEELGLDNDKLQACLAGGEAKVAVNKDYADGFRFGVAGTPTFFINGIKVAGVVPMETWTKIFEGK